MLVVVFGLVGVVVWVSIFTVVGSVALAVAGRFGFRFSVWFNVVESGGAFVLT